MIMTLIMVSHHTWMSAGPLMANNLTNFPTKDILRSLRHPNIICALAATEFCCIHLRVV